MTTVSLGAASRDLHVWLERVEAGETLVVTKGETPVAEVRPISAEKSAPRPLGLCRGDFQVPDDFDAALPDEVLRGFESR